MQELAKLVKLAREMRTSDIHVSQGMPLMCRIDGRLQLAPVE